MECGLLTLHSIFKIEHRALTWQINWRSELKKKQSTVFWLCFWCKRRWLPNTGNNDHNVRNEMSKWECNWSELWHGNYNVMRAAGIEPFHFSLMIRIGPRKYIATLEIWKPFWTCTFESGSRNAWSKMISIPSSFQLWQQSDIVI